MHPHGCSCVVLQTAKLEGAAKKVLAYSLMETHEILGLEMFAMVAAVVASGERLRGIRMMLFAGDNAAAGAQVKPASWIQAILAFIGSFRG